MIGILIYLIGVIVSWFVIAYINDNDVEKEKDDISIVFILFSWAIILFIVVGAFVYFVVEGWNKLTNGKFDYPTLTLFKKRKKQ